MLRAFYSRFLFEFNTWLKNLVAVNRHNILFPTIVFKQWSSGCEMKVVGSNTIIVHWMDIFLINLL